MILNLQRDILAMGSPVNPLSNKSIFQICTLSAIQEMTKEAA